MARLIAAGLVFFFFIFHHVTSGATFLKVYSTAMTFKISFVQRGESVTENVDVFWSLLTGALVVRLYLYHQSSLR